MRHSHLISFLCLTLSLATDLRAEESWKAMGHITHKQLSEISGIIPAHTFDGFWVHNDSGDQARLYAINQSGELLAIFAVKDAPARDWEDIAAVTMNGQRYLVCGDIGDNKGERPFISIICFPEPHFRSENEEIYQGLVTPSSTRRYRYPQTTQINRAQPHHIGKDAEALAIDPQSKELLILTKRELQPTLYKAPLDLSDDITSEITLLEQVVQFSLPAPSAEDLLKKGVWAIHAHMPTAMDLSSDGSSLVIGNYVDLWLYRRKPHQSWAEVLASHKPTMIPSPVLTQMESVCFTKASTHIVQSSEQLPAPLIVAPIPERE